MTSAQDLKIALLQTNLVWENPAENAKRIGAWIAQLGPGHDLIVLPEMWATGFTMKPSACGMEWNAAWSNELDRWPEPLRAMHAWAQASDAAVVGSLACVLVDEKPAAVNRCFFVEPEGTLRHYDKRHAFTFAGEDAHYRPGTERVEVEWRGWRILLQTCYDLRFPVFSRNRAGSSYDLAVYVANWPAVRRSAWSALLPARAIENQAYVAGANRVGPDGNGIDHDGGSAIIDPYGAVLATTDLNASGWVTATCDRAELERYREKFPVLADADGFQLTGGPATDEPATGGPATDRPAAQLGGG